MPSHTTPGRKGVYVELEEALLANVRALAERNGRGFKDEIQHALQRHLEAPPILSAPPLPPAEIPAPMIAAPAAKKRGRKPKIATATATPQKPA